MGFEIPVDVKAHFSCSSDTVGIVAPEGRSALDHCRAVRATPSGEYYLTYLARAFAYLDLVWIDTPLSDTATHTALRELVYRDDKEGRFARVDHFLGYLRAEEDREYRDYPQLKRLAWAGPFVARIQEQTATEKREIDRKFARYSRAAARRTENSGRPSRH